MPSGKLRSTSEVILKVNWSVSRGIGGGSCKSVLRWLSTLDYSSDDQIHRIEIAMPRGQYLVSKTNAATGLKDPLLEPSDSITNYTSNSGMSIHRRCFQLSKAFSVNETPLAPCNRSCFHGPSSSTCRKNCSHWTLNALSNTS
jgi:hypothetical protein